jgi:hypothetical protein
MFVNEGGVDGFGMLQHELLESGSLSRTRAADLMEPLEEGKPSG